MADHSAEQILDALVTTLTGLTTTGSNVERARIFTHEDGVTDALSIFMGEDRPIDAARSNQTYLDSELMVELVIHTKNANPEQQINLIKKEIVLALKADYTLGLPFVFWIEEIGFDAPELFIAETETASCSGQIRIRYRRSYTDASTV